MLHSCQVASPALSLCLHVCRVEHPYHNAIHAADVMQTTNVFLVSHLIESLNLRPLEVFSMLVRGGTRSNQLAPRRPRLTHHRPCWPIRSQVAAAIHDFRHPGVNNNFLGRCCGCALSYCHAWHGC